MVDIDREYLNINSILFENIKERLIDIFIEFYGEKHRTKITNTINSLLIIRTGYGNGTKKELLKDIKNIELNIKDYLVENYNMADNLKSSNYIESASVLVNEMMENYANSFKSEEETLNELAVLYSSWLYNKLVYKNFKKGTYIYLNSIPSTNYALEFYNQFAYKRIEAVYGSYYPDVDIPLITIHGDNPELETIIHEINHSLHKEQIMHFYNKKGVQLDLNTFAITGVKNDFVYEMFNSYMSGLLTERYKEKYGLPVLESDLIHSSYLQLDDFLKLNDKTPPPIAHLFTEFYKELKEMLISGDGIKILKVFGMNDYPKLNDALIDVNQQLWDLYETKQDIVVNEDLDNTERYYIYGLVEHIIRNIKKYRNYLKKEKLLLETLESKKNIKVLKKRD